MDNVAFAFTRTQVNLALSKGHANLTFGAYRGVWNQQSNTHITQTTGKLQDHTKVTMKLLLHYKHAPSSHINITVKTKHTNTR